MKEGGRHLGTGLLSQTSIDLSQTEHNLPYVPVWFFSPA